MTPSTFSSTSTEKNELTSFYWIRQGNIKNGTIGISIPDSVDEEVDMVNVFATAILLLMFKRQAPYSYFHNGGSEDA
jgi:hypothetical protein